MKCRVMVHFDLTGCGWVGDHTAQLTPSLGWRAEPDAGMTIRPTGQNPKSLPAQNKDPPDGGGLT